MLFSWRVWLMWELRLLKSECFFRSCFAVFWDLAKKRRINDSIFIYVRGCWSSLQSEKKNNNQEQLPKCWHPSGALIRASCVAHVSWLCCKNKCGASVCVWAVDTFLLWVNGLPSCSNQQRCRDAGKLKLVPSKSAKCRHWFCDQWVM